MRAKYLPAEQRRAEAVEAVVELAAHTNPETITTTEVAAHMRMTQGALFKHFPNKEALWLGTMEWVADRLLARIDRLAGAQAEPVAALEAMFLGHIDFIAEHPGVPRMIFDQLQRNSDTAAKRMARALLENYAMRLHRILSAGVAEGALSRELDIEAAATLYLGMIQGLVVQLLLHGDVVRMRADAPRVFVIYRTGVQGGAKPPPGGAADCKDDSKEVTP
ncbi:TetR/AcrR family transcriptional regulator [Albidovulum sp.]|uniref:TetR/AcrR family transcriptional regulator n=1 Tax=Albidovulum sp. TaxID=1872424 RepID=UPI0039B929F2